MDSTQYVPEIDTSRAQSIPSQWYLNKEFFEFERSNVFHNTWQYVGWSDWVKKPGQYFTCDVQGEPLVIVRVSEEKLVALSNVCRHRAGPIAQGCGSVESFKCRYHGWRYALTGELQSTPGFDGIQNWEKSAQRLKCFSVTAWGPFIFVNLEENPVPFTDWLGKIPHDLNKQNIELNDYRFIYRRDYVVNCNWKVYVDNYLEGFHIPLVHPSLFGEIDYSKYRVETFRYYSQQHAPIRKSTAKTYANFNEGAQALYYWLFPNFMLNIYPDNLSSNLILPIDENRTLTVFEWFVHRSRFSASSVEEMSSEFSADVTKALPTEMKLPKLLEKIVSFSHQVQLEDIFICESVQKGLKSKFYDTGRFAPKHENGVHHFHLLLYEFLQRDSESFRRLVRSTK